MNNGMSAMKSVELTEDDVSRLLSDTSSGSRFDVGAKIAATYGNNILGEQEKQMAEQIFRLLLKDTEIRVRASLAENLKESDVIPRDIVLSMASDVNEVALPVIECSRVLDDNDLLDIIHSAKDDSRYLAISRRDTLSEVVSDTLVDKGNEEVLESLLSNNGASISDNVFSGIINTHKENPALMEAITSRSHLPISVVEKLVSVVSTNIADSLKEKYRLPDEAIKKEVEKNRESETLALVRQASSIDDVGRLVSNLRDTGKLTPSIILSSLCQGSFDFFESSLAILSNIKVENARTLIADRGELGFRAIYNKSGLPDAMFPAVKLLLKIVRELDVEGEKSGTSRYSNRIVERILQYSENTPVDNISYIIALIRRVAIH